MAYKTILAIVTDMATTKAQLDTAINVARRHNAHLNVLCMGVDHAQTGYFYAGAAGFVPQEEIERCQEFAASLDQAVRDRLANEDILWSTEAIVSQLGALGAIVGMRARFADLVVAARPYSEGREMDVEAAVEAALFEGHVPVLLVPDTYTGELLAKRVVIAWNQSDEALDAVKKSLPLLQEAELVDITIIDPPTHDAKRAQPGTHLALFLNRHGVTTQITILAKTMPRISDVLSTHVKDTDADLVIMGAYGHSRFREAILGGATRHMMELADHPVLMAH